MRLDRAFIGTAWSSPSVRWQGAAANFSSLDLAVDVTRRVLEQRRMDTDDLTDIVLGMTVPQRHAFYGSTTVAGRIGAPHLTGPTISQACATSVACLEAAAGMVESEPARRSALLVTTDRTSNGPVLVYPEPTAMGGSPTVEHWVLDNFRLDPWAERSPTQMAEEVAGEAAMTREELDDVTAMRGEQYAQALAEQRAFQRRYMFPAAIPGPKGSSLVIEEDSGVRIATIEELSRLAPVMPNGVVTYGNQTHPADATAGMLVCGEAHARRQGAGEGIVRLLSTALARVDKGQMPKAPVPAARRALDSAGLDIGDVDVIVCHTPFAVNDIWFAKEMGCDLKSMNPYGCSLIYGHPQAPVGARAIAELIEALRDRGGGVGLFTGCAAGDTGGAAIVRLED